MVQVTLPGAGPLCALRGAVQVPAVVHTVVTGLVAMAGHPRWVLVTLTLLRPHLTLCVVTPDIEAVVCIRTVTSCHVKDYLNEWN